MPNPFNFPRAAALAAVSLLCLCPTGIFAADNGIASSGDPYLWLEDVTGGKSLAWVKAHNAVATNQLESASGFHAMQDRLLGILNSRERIPDITKHGPWYYNFWRDEQHQRGFWRRTTLEEYRKAEPAWETVLDMDQLAATEKQNWVWHGYRILKPTCDRCLIELSRGGADAAVIREFDLNSKQFVPDGFTVPEAKSDVAWHDRDTLYIATDFGPGSLTGAGYPRIIKEWHRGTPLSSAHTVFEAEVTDDEADIYVKHDHGQVYEFIERAPTFFSNDVFLRRGDQWVRIDKPADAIFETFGPFLLLKLRSDWKVNNKTYPSGALLTENLEDYLKGRRDFSVPFQPSAKICLSGTSETLHDLLLNELDNVHSRPWALQFSGGRWESTAIPGPAFSTVEIEGVDPDESDDYFMTAEDFLTPPTLWLGAVGKTGAEKLKGLSALFDAGGLEIQQFTARSKDDTRVPYFQVARKGLKLDGGNITLLTGYGGFEIPKLPAYNPRLGAAWLERGGVYVVANIRGGGEFGPQWHEAARKKHRQRAYDDFVAVAEDLMARGVTSPKRLGIEGRSNGGLLMGVMLTQRPDLFGAIHCGSPLLDMRRYNKLLAGASWMDEYGNPDKPEDWAYIQKYSPYQNVRPDRTYPPILITTSTRDDRVHPGHARKMAARLEEQGHKVLYYENTEGGHAAADNNQQAAFMDSLAYEFLWTELSR